MPNGQTSWINGDYAIQYYPGYWDIGYLVDIGSYFVFMYASNDFNGLTDDENEWIYSDGSNWISPTDPTDIQITCVRGGSGTTNSGSCNQGLIADGFCDVINNNLACTYDGGDCCSNSIKVGDGICNDETNNVECNYDGGDCK